MATLKDAPVKKIPKNTTKVPSDAPDAPGRGTKEETISTKDCAANMLSTWGCGKPNPR